MAEDKPPETPPPGPGEGPGEGQGPAAPESAPPAPAVEPEPVPEPEPEPEEEPEPEAPEVTYPLSFGQILFSFKGRLHRKPFWLKGALPLIVIGTVVQGAIGAITAIVVGASLLQQVGIDSAPDWAPKTVTQQVGERVIGRVTADTGPARVEAQYATTDAVNRFEKVVVIGGRKLAVTATKKPDGGLGYDMAFAWADTPVVEPEPPPPPLLAKILYGVSTVVSLVLLWCWFALAVKRFHDRDKSGWWSILGLIPILNLYVLVVVGFLKGSAGDNRFGPDPIAAEGG